MGAAFGGFSGLALCLNFGGVLGGGLGCGCVGCGCGFCVLICCWFDLDCLGRLWLFPGFVFMV